MTRKSLGRFRFSVVMDVENVELMGTDRKGSPSTSCSP
jgi:hypothetical protein